MTKINYIIILAVLFGVIIGFSLIYFLKLRNNYVAVFLDNGAIYFGKLSTFPRLKLDKAIFPVFDQNGNIISLQRFSDAFWQPQGPLYLNSQRIIFIAPIQKESQIVNLIEGKIVAQPQTPPPSQQPQNQQQNQPSNATTTQNNETTTP